jgi:alpha-D-ribose 1-methylphosphonate 5-triphosphate synthase subunit PhnH
MNTIAGSAPAAPSIPSPGFADPTRESQAAFRAVLDALAHPTRSYSLAGPAQPPAALGPGLGAIALTVLDEDATVWLGGALAEDAEAIAWLGFHTGARVVEEPASADFAFIAPDALPPLDSFRLGTDEAPHLSTTIVLDVRGVQCDSPRDVHHFTATGPGINVSAELDAPWQDGIADFAAQWRANTRLFPRGVDLLIVDEASVSALPRTTQLAALAALENPGKDA